MPLHQRLFIFPVWGLSGLMVVGTFLDAIGNAISLLSVRISVIGSALLTLGYGGLEFALRRHVARWTFRAGQTGRVKGLGIRPRTAVCGGLVLLWVPHVLRLAGGVASKLPVPRPPRTRVERPAP
jgi:hypothetical protein